MRCINKEIQWDLEGQRKFGSWPFCISICSQMPGFPKNLEVLNKELIGDLCLPGQRSGPGQACVACTVCGKACTVQTQTFSEEAWVNCANIQSETCHIRLPCSGVIELSLHQKWIFSSPSCWAFQKLFGCPEKWPTYGSGSHFELKLALSIAYRFVIFAEAYWSLCTQQDIKTLFPMLFEGSGIQHELGGICEVEVYDLHISARAVQGEIPLLMAVDVCLGLVIIDTFRVIGEKELGNNIQFSEWHPWIILMLYLLSFCFLFFSPVHATKQTPDVSVCNTVPVHSVDRKQVENNILSFYSLCISK